jgi:hypothetical protein
MHSLDKQKKKNQISLSIVYFSETLIKYSSSNNIIFFRECVIPF